ncbi:AraC-like DNA-binding protein [Pararhizobium capsulatum DSM 1112]|uniref:AraC-like DNA-binding protein n=1 Tax=Pararhizobium capsulatum DSM 1112 TaxID=1121113 RepID=A0ABU0BY39_9HYPH|nr:AraC family transcriptional regulator [Pararhizobium capsulatum]MDQ0322847.1 AraC-like DNA-binding protein [Pararhizobium capsulatum DSM 1112]
MVAHHDDPIIRGLTTVPTGMGLAVRLAVVHLERLGIDPAPILAQVGLSEAHVANRKRVSNIAQIEFLGRVSHATKDSWIGLTLARDFDLRQIGMLYYVVASSHCLGDALRRLERYSNVANEALAIRVEKEPVCRIGLTYTGVSRHLDLHQMECLAVVLLRLCRQVVGGKLVPLRASFIHHRSGDLRTIERLLGCDIQFDAYADEMQFDGAILDLPLVEDDPFLNELMVRMCEDAISVRVSNASPFRTLVENTIAPLLPHAEARAKTVAHRLGLSERTFARRLAKEDLSFGEILDEMRRDLAVRYLEEKSLQTSQIAWLLGFQQPSAFSHACRRWTGQSPSEIRRPSNLTNA